MATAKQTVEVQELRDTFEVDGVTYLAFPTLEEFIEEAGLNTKSTITRIMKALKKEEIDDVSTLLSMTLKELADVEGISVPNAKVLFIHATRVKIQGKLVIDYDGKTNREKTYSFLTTGSTSLDEMMTHSGGEVGWRSKTLIELFGYPASGKTQICYTIAAMVMRSEKLGGWGRGIAYIDSEGSFVLERFKYVARYWGVEVETLKEKFLYSRVSSFDEVEQALNDITKRIKELDIGLLVVDSIMDPLKSQYPVGGTELRNLQPRQKHLKRVLDKLKNNANIYNLIVIYTNHVRSNIDAGKFGPKFDAQGGAVLGHASDIKILLDKPSVGDLSPFKVDKKAIDKYGLKMARAKIVDCGFLPEKKGFFMIGPMGIADPNRWKEVVDHCEKIAKDGYISIDSQGGNLSHLNVNSLSPEVRLERTRILLYGERKYDKDTKKKDTKKKDTKKKDTKKKDTKSKKSK